MFDGLLSRRRFAGQLAASIGALAGVRATRAAPLAPERLVRTEATTIDSYCPDSQEWEFLRLINTFRASYGVGKLALSGTLGAAAEHHSKSMAKYNYFSHTLRGGISWSTNIRNHGYTYNTSLGENIAAGHGLASSTFTQWKNSSGHRANMLSSSYHAIGIGRAYSSSSTYGWYWTTTFGGMFDQGIRC